MAQNNYHKPGHGLPVKPVPMSNEADNAFKSWYNGVDNLGEYSDADSHKKVELAFKAGWLAKTLERKGY